MSWHTITAEDVLGELTPQEKATLVSIQGAVEQLPTIVGRVIASARGAIRAGGYALGDEGTTPDQLDGEIIAIARWRWLISFPQLQRLQTKERKDAAEQAQARLDKVSQQEINVEPPVAGTSTAAGSWSSENKIVMRTHPVARPSAQAGDGATPYAGEGQDT